MKPVILLVCICYAFGAVVEKRLGVPLSAELGCQDPEIEFVADDQDCQVFYICDHRWPKIRRCPADSIWDTFENMCLDKYEASNPDCGYVPPERPIDTALLIDTSIYEADEWACADGLQYIAFIGRCDGFPHCADGSDEVGCAIECTAQNCQLPDCKCSETANPGGLFPGETPQLVVITWDEAIRVEDYNHLYQQVFKRIGPNRRRERRRNPNGCPAVGTFFASHQFTDYAAAQALFKEGNEIAAHSISKTVPDDPYWKYGSKDLYRAEFADQRVMFSNLAGIPPSAIRGMRASGLQTSGDAMIDMMEENGFLWDSSYATDRNSPPIWPYSLHYRSTAGCPVPPCPKAPHDAWEIPMVNFIDTNDTMCENVDSCYFPTSYSEASELFRENFNRHYLSNKAVFMMSLRSRFFLNDGQHNMEALMDFLDELEALSDVYIVTASQALEWVRDPVPLANVAEVFDCDYTDRAPLCAHPNLCSYFNITYQPNDEDHPGDRFFQTCFECPPVYPWVGNPSGSA